MKAESLLFVCHGNICRSPMAEMMAKEKFRDMNIEIASVATSREEIGNDIYPPAKRCLQKHGIHFEHRAARQIIRQDYEHYDRIFVMDENNIHYLRYLFPDIMLPSPINNYHDKNNKIRLLMSLTGKERDVADPWYTGDFESTYKDIEAALEHL